jgi:methionyl-tRNA formyltransferase
VWAARPVERTLSIGEIVADGGRLLVGCGKASTLELLEVQVEGKKRMAAADFIRGNPPKPGEKLGQAKTTDN